MKKIIIFIFIFIISFHVFGEVSPWIQALSGYKPMYFITGVGDDQVKVRVGFKFDFFYPHKIGLYLGYTQLMFWDLYKLSAPFTEINFIYDLFWRFESGYNFADDYEIPFIDYIQLGLWEHQSNGWPPPENPEDENLSRGMNRIYIQLQSSIGTWLQFGINLKYFYVIWLVLLDGEEPDNPYIQDYIGSFVGRAFFRYYNRSLNDYIELYGEFATGGGVNGLDFAESGFLEVGFKSYIILSRFRLYVQYYQGYFESILNYNRSAENVFIDGSGEEFVFPFSLRFGVILE